MHKNYQIFCTRYNYSYILCLYRSYLAGFQCEGNKMSYRLQPLQEFNYSVKQEQDWQIAYAYKGYGYAIKRSDGSLVCNLPDGLRPQEKQLAELICALPQILEALQDVTAFCAPLSPKGKDVHDNAKAILRLFK